jgi:hypothetical protein
MDKLLYNLNWRATQLLNIENQVQYIDPSNLTQLDLLSDHQIKQLTIYFGLNN